MQFTPQELAIIATFSPLPEPPADPTNAYADDPAAARLGQFLFFDRRLSRDGATSCATCHDPSKSWTDGQSRPARFSLTLRHVPSLWNVAFNRWFFWDGRADSLWSQALEPLEEPTEHGGTRNQYAALINNDPQLRRAYEHVFGPMPDFSEQQRFPRSANAVSTQVDNRDSLAWARMRAEDRDAVTRVFVNIGKAIAAYERLLISRHSPFDQFVEGLKSGNSRQLSALSESAQRGLQLFVGRANCRSCHHGPNFTDGEFHNTGIEPPDSSESGDAGRFLGVFKAVTSKFNTLGPHSDAPVSARKRPTAYLVTSDQLQGQFKTPSLRNVARTAPYMHRGQLATLEDVVNFYSTLQPPTADTGPAGAAIDVRAQTHIHGGKHARETVLVPLHLSRQERSDLVTFLESLTDESLPPALTTQPSSPE